MKTRAIALLAGLALTACGGAGTADLKPKLWPSAWQAVEITGNPVAPEAQVTLAFEADGRVSGNATCNRYGGPSTLEGQLIGFGALVSTRMACVGEGLNAQEAAFLGALEKAERAAIAADGSLEIYSAGEARPTRFRPGTP